MVAQTHLPPAFDTVFCPDELSRRSVSGTTDDSTVLRDTNENYSARKSRLAMVPSPTLHDKNQGAAKHRKASL
jgi:hypothetical protein